MVQKIKYLFLLLIVSLTAPELQAQNNRGVGYLILPKAEDLDFPHPRDELFSYPFALQSNLLYDVTTALNIGIKIPIYSNWSIGADWTTPWWINSSKHNAFEVQLFQVEGLYWFNRHNTQHLFYGWNIGLYTQAGYYDLEHDKSGRQGDFWGVGVCGGYSFIIGERLRLGCSLGLGVVDTSYRRYDP
ncbi:MAG: DUF3575 domain-containing protein [Rikenellaceae bacterium]